MKALKSQQTITLLVVGLILNVIFLLGHSRTGHTQVTLDVLHQFPRGGEFPWAELIEGSDGMLYGTTQSGGVFGQGTVFKINKDGTGFWLVDSFQCDTNSNGCFPYAGVIEGRDGALYGTTFYGGASGEGTAYRINKDGTGFSLLRSFQCTCSSSCYPIAGVIEGSDGALYG